MIVTTSLRTTKELISRAERIAFDLEAMFLSREHQAINQFQSEDLLIVEKEKLIAYPRGTSVPLFFHPNSAMFRIKRIARGEHDPLIDAAQLEKGMSFLDCTLGLGSDSIAASAVVSETGIVVGIEENKLIAFIVKEGMNHWKTNHLLINEAMKRVNVVQANHEKYLADLPSDSFDVVYFDPMFEEQIDSDGLAPLKQVVQTNVLSPFAIEQAKRVARKRIVLKDHFRSKRFEAFGFHVIKRPAAKFHFGFIEV